MLLAYREKKVQKVMHQNVEIHVVVMRGVLHGVFLFSASYS